MADIPAVHAVFKAELIGDKCNKFGVCRLALADAHCVAEKRIDGVDIASVPCRFDCMADSTFNS